MDDFYNVFGYAVDRRHVLAPEWRQSENKGRGFRRIRHYRGARISVWTIGAVLACQTPMAAAGNMLYINDNLDGSCGAFRESDGAQITHPICSADSVVGLRAQDVAVGAMLISPKGSFINGGLSLGGAFDVGANQIHALQAGTLGTDAVNVSQLSPLVDALGGGAKFDAATGAVSGPGFVLANGGAQTTVGAALSSLDGAISADKGNIATLQTLIGQDAGSGTITLGSTLGGDLVDLSSKSAGRTQTRQLTGLSEATLSYTSTDAVTGAQLYATNQDVAANAGSISELQTSISQGRTGLVQQDETTRVITVGGASGGGKVDLTGNDGERILSGVADGVADHDAVTIAQLKAVGLVDPGGRTLAALVYDDLALGTATLGGNGGTVIRNLAAGTVAAGSMEAVNGGQLYELRLDMTNRFGALNGRLDTLNQQVGSFHPVLTKDPVPGDGKIEPVTSPPTAPGSTAVGTGALAGSTDSTALGSQSTASGNGAVAVGAHSVAERDNTVSVGAAGSERQVTNVAAGVERTDAANWGQVQDAVHGVQHWVRERFRQAGRLANAGTAAAMAMTNVPQAYAANQSALGAGIGSFKGQSALAVGLSTITPGGRWVVKGSLSGNTQGDVGVGMGAAMVW